MTVRTVQVTWMLDVAAEHAEGIARDAAGARLLFVDIPTGRVFSHNPETKTTTTHRLQCDVSFVHPTIGGELLVAVREGIAILASDGRLRPWPRRCAPSPSTDSTRPGGCRPS